MKKIHPIYFPQAQVVCSCGNTFTTGSTKEKIIVEVCSKCHPYYSGEHRYLDTKGRVDAFQKRTETAQKFKQMKAGKKVKKVEKEEKRPKTLKELLEGV